MNSLTISSIQDLVKRIPSTDSSNRMQKGSYDARERKHIKGAVQNKTSIFGFRPEKSVCALGPGTYSINKCVFEELERKRSLCRTYKGEHLDWKSVKDGSACFRGPERETKNRTPIGPSLVSYQEVRTFQDSTLYSVFQCETWPKKEARSCGFQYYSKRNPSPKLCEVSAAFLSLKCQSWIRFLKFCRILNAKTILFRVLGVISKTEKKKNHVLYLPVPSPNLVILQSTLLLRS